MAFYERFIDNIAYNSNKSKVVDEMTAVLANSYGNPSSTHFLGRDLKKTIIELSRKFLNTFNAKPKEIFLLRVEPSLTT